jgi:hypothetical protein
MRRGGRLPVAGRSGVGQPIKVARSCPAAPDQEQSCFDTRSKPPQCGLRRGCQGRSVQLADCLCGYWAMVRSKKMAVPCGTAKFREETSKKADSATRGRIAAVHNAGDRSFAYK